MQIGRSVIHFPLFLAIVLGLGVLLPIAFETYVEAATCYEDVIVSNAAFEPANATYRFVDYYQYKPRYRRIHDDGTFYPPYENITWGGNRWIIMVGGTNRYEASADTPTPPTVVGCDGCPNPWLRLAWVYGPTTITVQGGEEFVSLGGPTTTKLTTGEAYVYAPKVPEGCAGSYAFSILNQPVWMSFDATTGALTGTPTAADIGTYSGIQITATDSDGDDVVTEVFAIEVENASEAGGSEPCEQSRIIWWGINIFEYGNVMYFLDDLGILLSGLPCLEGSVVFLMPPDPEAYYPIEDLSNWVFQSVHSGVRSVVPGSLVSVVLFDGKNFVNTTGPTPETRDWNDSFPTLSTLKQSLILFSGNAGPIAELRSASSAQWIPMLEGTRANLSPEVDNQITTVLIRGGLQGELSLTLFDLPDQQGESLTITGGTEVDLTKLPWAVSSLSVGPGFVCGNQRLVPRGSSLEPLDEEAAWAEKNGLHFEDQVFPEGATGTDVEWVQRTWSRGGKSCIQTIRFIDPLSPCLEERLVLRGESTTPTEEELDWAAQLGLSYFDTPKPDGAIGDEIEWIERVWYNETHLCAQPIAILEPPLDCPVERSVFCYESFDPTEEELAWASAQGLIYWDDGPKPLPEGGACGIQWIERFWGEYEGDESACTQSIDVISPTPTIDAPADTSVSGCVSVASIAPSMTGAATVDDPCGTMVSLEYQDEFHDDLNAELGTFHRVWKVTDQCGDTDRAVQTISIDPPHPYLTSSWAGTFTQGSLVVDNIYIRPQPPIFGNDQAHTLLIVAFAENTAEPPEEEEPVPQTATLTASVDGVPAGSAAISVLPGESGLRYEIRIDIPQVPGCHEVSLSMGGTTIYGSVFIHPIGEDPDF